MVPVSSLCLSFSLRGTLLTRLQEKTHTYLHALSTFLKKCSIFLLPCAGQKNETLNLLPKYINMHI